jgi:hypothetical protein
MVSSLHQGVTISKLKAAELVLIGFHALLQYLNPDYALRIKF